MGTALQHRIDTWKKLLLDLGKRNRLINFKEGKRNNVKIISPTFDELYNSIVVNEKNLDFPYASNVHIDEDGEEEYGSVIYGDIETSKPIGDLQKTLRTLRLKAKSSIEEQGINILYLTFGSVKWKESENSDIDIVSPLVLVPVHLTIESSTSPYVLSLHDDEIVVNPSLIQKLEGDFGITIPEFDSLKDDIETYVSLIDELVSKNGWSVNRDTHLTVLSFLKINMYKDLERHGEKLNQNSVISAIAGESEPSSISEEMNNYDHDKKVKPIDTFQVVDADSSQQDAIILSKSGVSFVLQGPPGTGKSQTITNIISEALADGKKILFVSEKMAALKVVYNRLSAVGLSDFCFALHSHKAKKKDILRDLANSISIDRKRVREEVLSQLDNLERKRTALNTYQQELHTPYSALNYSIYYVNGVLAKLANAPDVIFEIKDADKINRNDLNEKCYILNELSKTIGKRSADYTNNVWRNSVIDGLSYELRHDIDSNFAVLIPKLNEIAKLVDDYTNNLELNIELSLNGLNSLIELLSLVGKSPIIPAKWLFDEDIEILLSKALRYKENFAKIIKLQQTLKYKYQDDIFSLSAKTTKAKILELILNVSESLSLTDNNTIISTLPQTIDSIDSITTRISNIYNEAKKVGVELGIEYEKIGDLSTIESLIELLLHNIKPTELWFNNISDVEKCVETSNVLHQDVLQLKKEILTSYDKEIFDIDSYEMLKRFRGNYNSIFRIFNQGYKADIKSIRQCLSTNSKVNYKAVITLLNKLKTVSDKKQEIDSNSAIYDNYFGVSYNGLDTNWSSISDAIFYFVKISNYFEGDKLPELLKSKLIAHSLPVEMLSNFRELYVNNSSKDLLLDIENLHTHSISNQTDCSEIIELLNNIATNLKALQMHYNEISTKRCEVATFDETLLDISALEELQTLLAEMSECKQEIERVYEHYYNGDSTSWDKTVEALSFAIEFKSYINQYNLPRKFIEKICEDHIIVDYCKDGSIKLCNSLDGLNNLWDWTVSLFESTEDFANYQLYDLIDRLIECKDKKHLLEEWVDYRSNRRKCDELGLSEYVARIEDEEISADKIVDTYLKRFYRLWLDAVLPQFPAVQSFRGHTQEQTIKEFKELDKYQFTVAQSRVRERVTSRMPDFNAITSTRDEVGVLKRELNKQRKLMPLRKLFKAIPNLITSLRPCFMMSPLSVSLFLEADSYEFDMVIFDEASQVHTEDAIGAIMRGKQVIIVGDTKQLPPNTTFTNSINDDGYDADNEEEDDYAGAYQSILDESVSILPERSLLWHYRSRHEDLITFSNVKIYNNSLITFPSSVEKAKDCGVEYIYVPDGVYDRGGKRSNAIEARRVAELIFEHYRKYPKRTLGVVTFSEAQMQAVDGAIRHKRQQNPQYDRFFAEDINEPFFIKNIENVQGDERDTIIFSIGYAKDHNGTISMNFGALNKDGGHRRLNVAITRAKHNVKLVGSIVPTDINLEKTSADGVRLLRSYIEFAQHGVSALQRELSYNNILEFDSPFEEAVYGFLVENGYEVSTQVGCSGYRIDMAIKDPKHSGLFAIGIECDGATYHSSRTARERDRLRQDVLEGMGWKIHRIWSTDWIKAQKSEGQKLLVAVERALSAEVVDGVYAGDTTCEKDTSINIIDIEEDVVVEESNVVGYGFIPYDKAQIHTYCDMSGEDMILKIIEVEQPIHFEELCRRAAPLFDNQKATVKVRNGVDHLLNNHFSNDIFRKDDFITLQGFEDIKVRIPNDDGYIRNIAHISDDELGLAMITIASHSFGITPEDLFIATARELGFKRTSENISNILRNTYEKLLADGKVREVDCKVSVY